MPEVADHPASTSRAWLEEKTAQKAQDLLDTFRNDHDIRREIDLARANYCENRDLRSYIDAVDLVYNRKFSPGNIFRKSFYINSHITRKLND